jgi:transposase-like protein
MKLGLNPLTVGSVTDLSHVRLARGVYGASVSKNTVPKITDKVVEEMNEWANRPLDWSTR